MGFLGDYALNQLFNAVDWVLDPANNQIRIKSPSQDCGSNPIGSLCSFSQFIYASAQTTSVYTSSPDLTCSIVIAQMASSSPGAGITYKGYDSNALNCLYSNVNGSWTKRYYKSTNPYYNSSSPVPAVVATPEQIGQSLAAVLDNPTIPDSTKEALVKNAYKPIDKNTGKPKQLFTVGTDPDLNIQTPYLTQPPKILTSDNPVGDGLTKNVPDITDGREAIAQNDGTASAVTVTNPDGSTTSSAV